jgi:glutamine amidotransferase
VPTPPRPDEVITVVDYGAGNLLSVSRAIAATGQRFSITSAPADVERAKGLILPGVGSANDAMQALRKLDLVEALRSYAASGRPFFGVCVGLQLFFEASDEGGGVECLGILPGTVKRFEPCLAEGRKVPHMGWNTVAFDRPHPLLAGIPTDSHFYFVHSYYPESADDAAILGRTEYGVTFPSIVARDNVMAVQFHPEKSASLGLRMYENFGCMIQAHD